ncbi:hypothetical protein SAMN05216577_1187 [Pseudomonas citronellolis]|uniref:Uncharacterized protein n=1 Tax=Pseudomonas citronellolis TaxID=53408 RepID=A0AAQ1HPH8_9PSED|nr:hypothetical protein [Pseudomonas citronellolis]MCP1664864.1 hypothetical protein [Pseudomonas citronellolis]MCP1695677.1 hypothetical protein [Pseudomonas citronellolis]MCP1702700.1 hypothetical protein [Pseudomonas citronellolis]MCP1796585.1 hypothetical protein [Pseudomonas citronellolis]
MVMQNGANACAAGPLWPRFAKHLKKNQFF